MSETLADRGDVQAAARLLDIPYCPEEPWRNHKQARFLLWFGLEALYGGQAGGGKSSALLMAALQFIEVPGYAALLMRRRYTDLAQPGALMQRAHEWFGPTDAHWDRGRYTWVFPSGATLSFGYLHSEEDVYRYGSAEFQFIGIDEVTQFSEWQYRFMFSRLRRPAGDDDSGPITRVPLRMRVATNPGGRGHEWVRRRWGLGTHREDGADTRKRQFFPAALEDNPFVDAASYREAMAELDPVTRARLERGDWTVRSEDAMLRREWFEAIDHPPDDDRRPVRYWDLAATEKGAANESGGRDPDWTAGAKCSRTKGGLFIIHHVTRFRHNPGDTERLVREQALRDGQEVPIWIEQEPGSSGKSIISHYRRNVLPEFTVHAHPKTRDKVTMASPWAARAYHGEVKLVDGAWLDDFLDEADVFPSGSHDDQIDVVSGCYAVLTERTGPAKSRVPGENGSGRNGSSGRQLPVGVGRG